MKCEEYGREDIPTKRRMVGETGAGRPITHHECEKGTSVGPSTRRSHLRPYDSHVVLGTAHLTPVAGPAEREAQERPPSRPELRVDLRPSPPLAPPMVDRRRREPPAALTHAPVQNHADALVGLEGAHE